MADDAQDAVEAAGDLGDIVVVPIDMHGVCVQDVVQVLRYVPEPDQLVERIILHQPVGPRPRALQEVSAHQADLPAETPLSEPLVEQAVHLHEPIARDRRLPRGRFGFGIRLVRDRHPLKIGDVLLLHHELENIREARHACLALSFRLGIAALPGDVDRGTCLLCESHHVHKGRPPVLLDI